MKYLECIVGLPPGHLIHDTLYLYMHKKGIYI